MGFKSRVKTMNKEMNSAKTVNDIAHYMDCLENTDDARFIRYMGELLILSFIILDQYESQSPPQRIGASTTMVRNLIAELAQFTRNNYEN